MNKRKILKLFTGVSSAVALNATGSVFLTSCANTNAETNFTSGLTKSLNVRNLATEEVPCPIYATPTQNPYLMAPDFKEINILNGTPLTEPVQLDEHGWPIDQTLATMTYAQFFMNNDVASAMAPLGMVETPVSFQDMAIKFKKNMSDPTINGKLDLKGLYKYDEYADETIKAFNCPYFYDAQQVQDAGQAVEYASVYSCIKTIDLSNNDLWYIPFFGYNANPANGATATEADKYIMRGREEVSSVPKKIGFESLDTTANIILDLRDNQITILPFADNVIVEGEEVNYDITNLFSSDDDPYPYTNKIAVDGNCIGYDLKNDSIFTAFTNYRRYNNMDAIAFNKDSDGFGYQSYAVYTNREQMFNEIVTKCCTALNEAKDAFLKRSLDAHVEEVQKLSTVMADSETKYPLGDCLNQLLAEYLSANGLVSAYLYTKYEIELTLLVQLFSNSDFVYDYPSYSSNNGCLNFSLQLGTPRICEKEGNNYVNKYATGQGSYFIAFSVYVFEATHVMAITVGILCSIVGLALVFVIVYYVWLRKLIARKRQLKDLEAIEKAQQDNKNGGKDA